MIPVNSAHWHLVLNHVPVLGSFLGLILAAYMYYRGKTAWDSVVLWWFLAIGALAIPVYLTGEPAEELVEGVAGVSHDAIEHHEEWAMWAFAMQELTGLFTVGVLLYRNFVRHPGHWIRPTLLGLVLITAGLMGYTAALGGRIHHPEIRPGYTPPEEHEESVEGEESAVSPEKNTNPEAIERNATYEEEGRNDMQAIELSVKNSFRNRLPV